ncbi:prenyltransferase [Candidatus Thorarchaeota archaeon]|nr:MAG: prenyltransferase [Candidatus Thorarchaeota archaeon]
MFSAVSCFAEAREYYLNDGSREVSKARAWLQEVKLGILPASIVPIFIGTAVAFGLQGVFHLDLFLLTLAAGIFLHWGADVTNDYFDHTEGLTGSDDVNVEFIRPYSGGSRTIQQGLLTPREVAIGAIVCYAVAGVIGIYLVIRLGWVILGLGLIGAFFGLFYSTPPIRLVKRGIGELVIGVVFGFLMVVGAYYVQVQTPIPLQWPLIIPFQVFFEPAFVSVPASILIALVLYINEFPDYVADRDAGKRTFVVRLGRRLASRGYALFMAFVYASIVIMVLLNLIRVESLLGLATLPLGVLGISTTLRHYDESQKLAPANWATITGQLFTGVFLALGYVLRGFSVSWEITLLVGVVLFIVITLMARKLGSPSHDA